MPSARIFAECRISSTRQSYYLPSAKKHALGEQLALGGLSLCRVPARCHSAKTHFAECQSVDTRQRASRAPHPPADDRYGGGCFCLPSAYMGTLGKQIFAECPTVDTRQTLSRAPHTPAPQGRYAVATNVPIFPRPLPLLFAECQLGDTRQKHASPSASLGHSAKIL